MSFLAKMIGRPRPHPMNASCLTCKFFKTGEFDDQVNWIKCKKGHLLIDKQKLVGEHRPYRNPFEKAIRVTRDSWAEDFGDGEPMLDRTDCEDWRSKR